MKRKSLLIIIAAFLILLIGLSLAIIKLINRPETSSVNKPTEQTDLIEGDNNPHEENNILEGDNNLQDNSNISKDDSKDKTDDTTKPEDENKAQVEDEPSSKDESEMGDRGGEEVTEGEKEGSSFNVKDHTYQVLSSLQKSVALISTAQQDGDFIVPNEVTYNKNTYTVTQVGGGFEEVIWLDADENDYYTYYKGAFSDKEFSSITIPKSVNEIADYSFYGINNLERVTINSNDITIGKYAISNLSGLMFDERALDINAKKVVLREGALASSLMTSININADQLSVGDYALALAPKGIKLPEGTTSIGNYAFDGCTGTFTIPKSVSSIGEAAFYKMKLNIDEGNKFFKIVDGILYDMEGTRLIRGFEVSGALSIPSSVAYIDQYAFAYSNVTEMTTSENMVEIPDYAFYQCPKLSDIRVTEGIEVIGDSAFYGNKLTNVTLPDSLLSIKNKAFYNNKSLKNIKLPQNITSIGSKAFYLTGVSEVQIPASVTRVGREAFGLYNGADNSSGISISFEEGNSYYEPKDNIIYEKGTSNILMIILDPNSDTILFPEGVEELGDINLINFNQEMQLDVSASVVTIDCRIFSYYTDPEEFGIVRFNGSKAPEIIFDKDTGFNISVLAPDEGKASYEEVFSGLLDKNIQNLRLNWY